jgi:threonine dehydrogenase-like Zn-dependent dehydrogenase
MAAIDARALRALPDDIGPITGVLMSGDALGVPVRGLRRTPGTPGADVLIIGLGPVGLGHAIVRRFAGANVSGVEPSAYRRELGLRVGAQRVFGTFAEVEDRPSVVIECTGRPDCIARAFELVDDLGVVLQSGECGKSVPIVPSEHLIRRELAWTGAWYYATEDYPEMANLVSRGLRIADICTHEVTPELAQQAFSEFLDGRTGKVVIRWT